jgi:hypothetical protein
MNNPLPRFVLPCFAALCLIFALSTPAFTMKGYVTTEEIAWRWNISVRQAQLLCQNCKIENASKFGGAWAIPDDTQKPTRTKVNDL